MKQVATQRQQLHVSPQLLQSVQLLQWSSAQLESYVQEQIDANPLLQLSTPPQEQAGFHSMRRANMETAAAMANNIVQQTLEAHLWEQLIMLPLPDHIQSTARYLIGNLNDDGYLTVPLAECALQYGCTTAQMEQALAAIHACEPAGIGARSLAECLLLQIERDPNAPSSAAPVVTSHLHDVANRSDAVICDALGLRPSEVQRTIAYIRSLDPRPGAPYTALPPEALAMADAFVEQHGAKWHIQVRDLFPLSVNMEAAQLLARGTKQEQQYGRQCMQQANWLIRCVEQRLQTLHRVLEAITGLQQEGDFLQRGPASLLPMTLQMVADVTGLHVSTVSRAVAHTVVRFPCGVYALRMLFSQSLPTANGETVSAARVKGWIQQWIAAENRRSPYSDAQLVDRLAAQGVVVARRTVMKYRQQLHIPNAAQRRIRS